MYIWKNEQKWTLKNPEDFSSGLAYVRLTHILTTVMKKIGLQAN